MRAVEEFPIDSLWSSASDEVPDCDERKRFEDSFEAALRRLERSGRAVDFWQEENLLSALGAAAMRSWALAAAFVTTALTKSIVGRPAVNRGARRTPLPLPMLRRRFEQIRAAT
jgi:hypothetical protein